MQPTVSLMVAKDIQRRAHAEAARHRRYVAAAPAAPVTQGKRWIVRLWASLPLHDRSPGRIGA
jgi:hypothetical protein